MKSLDEIRELADLALIPPLLNTNPLPKYGYDKLDYGMTVGIERTRGGRLWASWVAGGDNAKAYMVFATSDDNGTTWSDPRLVIDPAEESMPLTRSAIGGVPWLDPQGRLWIYFSMSASYFDGRMGIWTTRCDNPDSESPEWSAPTRIWHGFALNKPIVLSSGEWALPAALWPRENITCCAIECLTDRDDGTLFADSFHELDEYRISTVLVSSDEGLSWELRGGVNLPCARDFDEPVLIERQDGSLWMILRSLSEGMWQTTSNDEGITWSEPTPWLAHVNSRHLVQRLPSGRLLLVKHGIPVEVRTKSRSHLTAYLSEDDGITWKGGLVLDQRDGVSYPDGAMSSDGTIFVSYDYNRDTDGEVLLARFREEDVFAGKGVSSDAALCLTISRPNPHAVIARHVARKEAILRRLVGNTTIPFTHVPKWRVWDGVAEVATNKLNMNNGGALPALSTQLPPEICPESGILWIELTPAAPPSGSMLSSHDPTGGTHGREGFVSFANVSSAGEGKLGYAQAYVHSPEGRRVTFILGADFWMQFRVNGKTYIDHSIEMRPTWAPDLHEFRCDVPILAGWNLIEVKVASGALGFAFACQIGNPGDLKFSTTAKPEIAAVS